MPTDTRTKDPLAKVARDTVRSEWVDFCQCQGLTDSVLSKLWGVSPGRVGDLRRGHNTHLTQWQADLLPADVRELWDARRRTYALKIAAAVAAVDDGRGDL